MALSAVIFDVDGTLIDSNDAHVQAWDQALRKHEYKVSPDRIAVEIGKGGDRLIPSILGQQIDQQDGESFARRIQPNSLISRTPIAFRLFPVWRH